MYSLSRLLIICVNNIYIVWLQKMSILPPPPLRVTGNVRREAREFKDGNFKGVQNLFDI